MRWCRIAVCILFITSLVWGQSSHENDPIEQLPVTRVILYKNGVGYFEHGGRVRGSQDVNIDFTTAQLNDVLKSLTVLDLGKGRITGVSYNSTAPLERRLGLLRLPVGENPTTASFLSALRGARLEVTSGSASAIGTLLSVDEREIVGKNDDKMKLQQVSVITDSGEVRTFDLTPATSVRILEKDLNQEISKYMKLMSSSRDQDVRRMTISTAGNGERDLLVSYISEVPVWKSTYRIVVPSQGKPLLQGWAVVDNTVGEDWKNVQLSLVAGAPQSFVQELSQPYYARRPVVGLPENAMITPQMHEPTLEAREMSEAVEVQGAATAPVPHQITANNGSPGVVVSGMAVGIGAGSAGGRGGGTFKLNNPVPITDTMSKAFDAFGGSPRSQELGDLFEYKLQDRVTIPKNQSALVPILQARVDAEKVSVWNPAENRALRALWVENSSGLTLDGGSFNVLEEDAFAGEGLMDAIKPGEKRLLSYAADMGLLVDAKQESEQQRVTRIAILRGAMFQSTEEQQQKAYTIRNRDNSPRTVIIEHPVRAGWKLTDGEQPAESTTSFYRFRVTVEPNKTAKLIVKEYCPLTNRYELSNITDDQIKYFLSQKTINPQVERALRRVASAKDEIAAIDAQIATRKTQMSSIAEDQQRVRENMKALKGSAQEKALIERYAREMNEQEDKVQTLHREMADLRQKREAAQKVLDDMIEGMTLEAKL
ncbi:MAG TPA: DUF4139 domain-containing protein [Terriglobales bacterium]|nr:DUF4139 domain-containing protein [Terriglobales bacterium]